MARRGHGEGSISRRADGRYEGRYYADTPEGRKRKAVYGKTRKEVAEMPAKAIATKDEPAEFVRTNMTMQEFMAQYEEAAKGAMKRRSFETYRDIARCHLLPAFGNVKLSDLSRERVQKMYARKRDQGLSPARVRRIHGVLSAALNKAVLWRLVERNVCKEVSPPRVPPPEIRPLNLEEAKLFLDAAESDRYHALFVVGLTTGARWGELAGLYWSDLDLECRVMHIQRSLIKGKGGYTIDTPKTRGSRRSVTPTKRTVAALQRHREHQQAEGFQTEGDTLIFRNTAASPVNHSHFMRRHFKPALERAGLQPTTWHVATRHTCTCILLLERVNPKSVAVQMGWSSVSFMLDTYARFLPGWGDDGVMEGLLG